MPNTPSARKEQRKSYQRRLRNRAAKSALRTETKKAIQAIQSGSPDAAVHARSASSELDKAAQRRVIHPRKAARLKSRLDRQLQKAAKPPA
jgi:small subunit ribosomal protein S20